MKDRLYDSSMLKTYRACPRRYYWRYERHLVEKGQRDYVPAFGAALHEALAVWYKGGTKEKAEQTFIQEWLPYDGQDPAEKRTMFRGLTILRQYWEKYPEEPFEVVSPDYIETGFALELGPYLICGRMDGIVRWNVIFEGLVVLEHKFSNSKGFLVTEPNQQIDTYIWAASSLCGEQVIGALFNQVYHTAKNPEKNDFVRELTKRSPEQMKDWEVETIEWLNRLTAEKCWPKNTNNCGAYHRKCPYIPLCLEMGPLDDLLTTLYIEDRWEPYPIKEEKDEHSTGGRV